MAPQGVVRQSLVTVGRRTARVFVGMELKGAAPLVEVPSRPSNPLASRMEVVQRLIQKAGFSKEVARVAAADPRHSAAALCQSKRFRFLVWCDRRSIDPFSSLSPRLVCSCGEGLSASPELCVFFDRAGSGC